MIEKCKVQSVKCKVLIAIILLLLLYPIPYTLYPAFAQQTCLPAQSPNPRVASGLISTPSFSDDNKFGNDTGKCVVDSKASFAPFKIPTYADLKSLYYAQAKAPVRKGEVIDSPTQGQFTSVFTQNDAILVNGNLPDLNYTGTTKPTIIFVEGNLSINNDITYGDENSGLVFVVRNNVNIAPSVTRIDAVIIAQGIIYTAGGNCTTSNEPASALTINGSLVSLEGGSIRFCRTLGATNGTAAAEMINQQPKYLVILKDLLSDTLQKWSEIVSAGAVPVSSPDSNVTPACRATGPNSVTAGQSATYTLEANVTQGSLSHMEAYWSTTNPGTSVGTNTKFGQNNACSGTACQIANRSVTFTPPGTYYVWCSATTQSGVTNTLNPTTVTVISPLYGYDSNCNWVVDGQYKYAYNTLCPSGGYQKAVPSTNSVIGEKGVCGGVNWYSSIINGRSAGFIYCTVFP